MHPNPRIQEEACLILSENYREEALPRLLDLFCHHDPKVYRAAVKGIGFFGSDAFDPLIDLYATTDPIKLQGVVAPKHSCKYSRIFPISRFLIQSCKCWSKESTIQIWLSYKVR